MSGWNLSLPGSESCNRFVAGQHLIVERNLREECLQVAIFIVGSMPGWDDWSIRHHPILHGGVPLAIPGCAVVGVELVVGAAAPVAGDTGADVHNGVVRIVKLRRLKW